MYKNNTRGTMSSSTNEAGPKKGGAKKINYFFGFNSFRPVLFSPFFSLLFFITLTISSVHHHLTMMSQCLCSLTLVAFVIISSSLSLSASSSSGSWLVSSDREIIQVHTSFCGVFFFFSLSFPFFFFFFFFSLILPLVVETCSANVPRTCRMSVARSWGRNGRCSLDGLRVEAPPRSVRSRRLECCYVLFRLFDD